MKYNPAIHNRKSYRMPKWNYAGHGDYFVTINTRYMHCCFGHVVNGEMILNDMGKIADELWLNIPGHFPHVQLDTHLIMPNHIHGILTIRKIRATHASPLRDTTHEHPAPVPGSLGVIIGSFKSACTKKFNESGMKWPGWHRNFDDRIVRNPGGIETIRAYIINNPKNWKK